MDQRIKLNGRELVVEEGISLAELIEKSGYKGRVSVWVDGVQLLTAEYPSRILRENEEIRIIRLVAGG